jgi:hypothetical protein
VSKVLRVLADVDYLHVRYYGAEQRTDYQLTRNESQPRESLNRTMAQGRTDE